MSFKAIFDTNIYIQAIQKGDCPEYELLFDQLPFTYLCSVVSAELYAGTSDQIGTKLVDKLLSRFKVVRRIVTPTHSSWNRAGKILAQIKKRQPKYRSKTQTLLNDTLIALCGIQTGATIHTKNAEDFELIQHYVPFELTIMRDS